MGEVYRALDPRLHREVAVKLLSPAFAHDANRLARFEREARLLASLQHPRIASVHGLEESDGRRFLVMELARGESLEARLARGALSVEDALAVARQVAEGLEAAHAQGIVHRDLKPSNVQLGPDGAVKLLDFGLAKALEVEDPEEAGRLSQSPTLPGPMTATGVILGTVGHMSPEQAPGHPMDRRTDVWALGCVLYEMLSGRRAFGGHTVSDIVAAVLRADPEWQRLPAALPHGVLRLLRRCLEKDPERRLHDAADARIELDEALEELRTSGSGPLAAASDARTAAVPRSRRATVLAVATAIGVLAAAVGIGRMTATRGTGSAPAGARSPVHALVAMPQGEHLAGAWGSLETGIRDLMEPLDQLLAREFPTWDPYPNGAKRQARLLVRHILIAEALLAEYGKAFEGLSEAQVVALAESFHFSRAKRRNRLEAILSGKER